jgi:hypothetical protein
VLAETGWNISRTADILGITRNTVRARIHKYDLRRSEQTEGSGADLFEDDSADAAAPRGSRYETVVIENPGAEIGLPTARPPGLSSPAASETAVRAGSDSSRTSSATRP